MFGNIDGYEYLNNMYFCLQGGNDNSFHLAVGTGSGATRTQQVGGIEQGSDGLAMFYREVPASANFTLSADITINAYNASVLNSFGLMARDDIYLDTVINDTLGDYVAAGQLSSLLLPRGTASQERTDSLSPAVPLPASTRPVKPFT